jgi:hypothetical protein
MNVIHNGDRLFSVRYELIDSQLVAGQRLRRLVSGRSLRNPEFDPNSVHVRFVVNWDRISSEQFDVSLSPSPHQYSIIILIHMVFLPEGKMGEVSEISKKIKHLQNSGSTV